MGDNTCNIPQMMSRAHRVKSVVILYGFPSACSFNLPKSTLVCLLNTCTKSFRILKWNVGVSNFRRVFHFSPVLKQYITRIVRESDYSSPPPLQGFACRQKAKFLKILSGNMLLTSIKGHYSLLKFVKNDS